MHNVGWIGGSSGPTDLINISILHSGSKAEDKGAPRNPGFLDPYVYSLYAIYPIL